MTKRTATLLVAVLVFSASVNGVRQQQCKRGEPCWPTQDDVAKLIAALDPAAPRFLNNSYSFPPDRPWAAPIPAISQAAPRRRRLLGGSGSLYSPDFQPLYGLGSNHSCTCNATGFAPRKETPTPPFFFHPALLRWQVPPAN